MGERKKIQNIYSSLDSRESLTFRESLWLSCHYRGLQIHLSPQSLASKGHSKSVLLKAVCWGSSCYQPGTEKVSMLLEWHRSGEHTLGLNQSRGLRGLIFKCSHCYTWGFPGGVSGKELACQCRRLQLQVRSLGQEDALEKEMATHSSILARRIPRTGEPGGVQSIGLQRGRHDSMT